MTPEINNLVDFLKRSGHPKLADDIEHFGKTAEQFRLKAEMGRATGQQLKILEVQERIELALATLDWLKRPPSDLPGE